MDKIPLNESMIEAETSNKSRKSNNKKKKSRQKRGQFIKKVSRPNRERSNTTDDEVKHENMIEDSINIKIDESYMEETCQQEVDKIADVAVQNLSAENNSFQNTTDSLETSDNKKDSLFISRMENEEEAKKLNLNNEYDLVTDKESELSFMISLDSKSNFK